jgi:hypothetical protein
MLCAFLNGESSCLDALCYLAKVCVDQVVVLLSVVLPLQCMGDEPESRHAHPISETYETSLPLEWRFVDIVFRCSLVSWLR